MTVDRKRLRASERIKARDLALRLRQWYRSWSDVSVPSPEAEGSDDMADMRDAADTILALLDAIDALAERVDALHRALRRHCFGSITAAPEIGRKWAFWCEECGARWEESIEGNHAPDCLAAPTAPKEAT